MHQKTSSSQSESIAYRKMGEKYLQIIYFDKGISISPEYIKTH